MWRHLTNRSTQRVPFDTAFPSAEKWNVRAAYPVATPGVPSMPLIPEAAHLDATAYIVPEDFVAAIPDGLFAASNSVVLSPNRHIVDESSTAAGLQYFIKRELTAQPRRLDGMAAPLRSRFHNFYHWIIDCMPRLCALAASPWSGNRPIRLLATSPPTALEQVFLDRFPPGTFTVEVVSRRSVYRVETLLFTPLKTQRLAGYLPAPYVEALRGMMAPKRPRTHARRLYVSRADAEYRKVANEDDLVAMLHDYGFEAVTLADRPLDEQAALFYDAEAVIAPHGAGLTNLVYADAAFVLELFPDPRVTPHYVFLCKSLGHRYRYLAGPAPTLNPPSFVVDLGAVRTAVERWDRALPQTAS